MASSADKEEDARVLTLLREEARRDPTGAITATFVRDSLHLSDSVTLRALNRMVTRGFLNRVYFDVCESGHVNIDALEEGEDSGIAYCPDCDRDVPHERYVHYRLTRKLSRGNPTSPKAERRKAPRFQPIPCLP